MRVALVSVLAVTMLAACGPSAPPPARPRPAEGAALARLLEGGDPRRGELLFARYCAPCHGGWGRGDGPLADTVAPAPRDLRKVPRERVAPERLFRLVRDGGTSVGLSAAMPAWGGELSDDEIADLVAAVRGLVP